MVYKAELESADHGQIGLHSVSMFSSVLWLLFILTIRVDQIKSPFVSSQNGCRRW